MTIHLIFPTARRLRPAVRALIDYVAATYNISVAGHDCSAQPGSLISLSIGLRMHLGEQEC